ncbi:hypothetical protein D9758_015724 [Tetrapyrgos nigripes]|uniref:mannan endo-1,4-beta-mannosidase n=1 Tax=Tetrapyrgos nigripes TaxID=182062 RepID=A0A8H5FS67_9AGAR|nr:hypothetical protein D9758_015724 [Tetrapyrgos nigripes]
MDSKFRLVLNLYLITFVLALVATRVYTIPIDNGQAVMGIDADGSGSGSGTGNSTSNGMANTDANGGDDDADAGTDTGTGSMSGSGSAAIGKSNSFAGTNNYFAYALPDQDRHTLLDAMKAADMKVLRTWVSGQDAGQKKSNSIAVPDLEHEGLGQYDDKILTLIDQLMVDAHERGIKLLIGMYDQNSLIKRKDDVYAQKYGSDGLKFYTDSEAISHFNNRITYILTQHKNALLGNKPWSELGNYIFGYEAQNEPMVFNQDFYKQHLSWICTTAAMIRKNVEDKNQLIFTGGGSAAASVQPDFFKPSCSGIDVVAIHDYNDDYDKFMDDAVSQAKAAGKKLLIEEWGSKAGDGQAANLNANIQKINKYKVPWLYWQLISNPDPGEGEDFEIQVNGKNWDPLAKGAKDTAALDDAPFDFSAALTL